MCAGSVRSRRVQADRGNELLEPLGVGRTRVHRDADAIRDDVRSARLDGQLTYGRDGSFDPARGVPDP